MAERGRYLYAVSRGLDVEELGGLLGLGEVLVEGVEVDGLVGLVSTVDLDEYGEEGLRRNLERLDWLETAARGHDAVVQAAAAVAPTAPMRLATIFRDDDAVRSRLAEQHGRITAVLDRIEGHEEWSVKVLTREHGVDDPETPVRDRSVSAPEVSGTEYLRRRRAERDTQEQDLRGAQDAAERVHDTLAALSTASRRLQPQDPRLTGHQGTMVHNAAYLVPRGSSDRFAEKVAELTAASRDVLVDARGPWPPYSFAMLEES